VANALAVALGGAVGALLRYYIGLSLNSRGVLPWGTLTVNLAGSFLIGLLVLLSVKQKWAEPWYLFAITGLLGGFTTFSAFSMENLQLVQDGKPALALVYALGSPALGLLLAWLGFTLAQRWTG
jgi:CrcB protein